MRLDGKIIAAEILEQLKKLPQPKKFLAGVLAGGNAASKSFLKQKEKFAKELGIDFKTYEFSGEISNDELRKEVDRISREGGCGGCILQLPLPGNLNAQHILNAIPPQKDVDVLGEQALGTFYSGQGKILPPSVAVIEEIIKRLGVDLSGSVVAVVGAGRLVGKPIATWLLGKTKELIVLDKGSDSDLDELKKADVVVLGTGVAGLIKPAMLKDGAGVIDFGYGKNKEGKTCGDLDELDLQPKTDNLKLNFYTPTPGGTGPILVAKILENFYKLNSKN